MKIRLRGGLIVLVGIHDSSVLSIVLSAEDVRVENVESFEDFLELFECPWVDLLSTTTLITAAMGAAKYKKNHLLLSRLYMITGVSNCLIVPPACDRCFKICDNP